jgi:hypothetical protein
MTFHYKDIPHTPLEMIIRLLQKSIHDLYPQRKYPASLERIEEIASLVITKSSGKATLANCLITWSKSKSYLRITKEK